MNMLSIEDTNRMSWNEVDECKDRLFKQIEAEFTDPESLIIAPLLRTGGIVGGMLSIKLRAVQMLPLQFKYLYNPTKISQLLSIPDFLAEVPSPMNVVLCEGNTSSGSTAIKASAAIREKYPHAKVYLATLTKVFGGPEELEGIEKIFYGRQTDEGFKATAEEKESLDLREGVTVFPWENADDELSDLNA
ncbi:MAG: hypothetical protein AB199_01550 [Parcubacteria bacterium C7867-004]|nr:MAG: hypothetical protein AB199_01550 [Parcubacteria bacterium C7867-004]